MPEPSFYPPCPPFEAMGYVPPGDPRRQTRGSGNPSRTEIGPCPDATTVANHLNEREAEEFLKWDQWIEQRRRASKNPLPRPHPKPGPVPE